MTSDTIITNGRWFDGSGSPSAVRNIGIRDGHVVAIAPADLDQTDCPHVIDATGNWVLPGMLGIHTHYDVEVLVGPTLTESLRHGVTTVVLRSCSLSTVHVDSVDAGDIFGRGEAIPREHVIGAVDEHKTWTNCEEYIAALEARPLGPNVAAFIGHSDMRAATMGLDRATQKRQRPTRSEQAQMEKSLDQALRAGFVGISSQQLLFDKLDGEVCRSRTLPATYAKPRELRRLKSRLRRAGRVMQSGPDIQNPLHLGSQAFQSLGIFRNPLKTSLLSAADVKSHPYAIKMLGPLARLANRLGGNFRWQHRRVGLDRGGLHPVDTFLDLVLKKLARDPGIQMGFSDAGAHLRNMAFYNMGLRFLRHGRQGQNTGRPFMTIEQAAHRLTGELADWYGIDAGHLRIGDRADIVVIDPDRLDESLEDYAEAPVEQYGGLSRMVNRNDDTVRAVFVAGRAVFLAGEATSVVGAERTGRFLRAEHKVPARTVRESELSSVS